MKFNDQQKNWKEIKYCIKEIAKIWMGVSTPVQITVLLSIYGAIAVIRDLINLLR